MKRKRSKIFLVVVLAMIFVSQSAFAVLGSEQKDTVYVSAQNGKDSNDGTTTGTAFKTLSGAYAKLSRIDKIILLDDTTYVEPPIHTGDLTIKGNTASVTLTLPGEVSLKGDLTIDTLTVSGASSIYANGYKLKITETVTSAGTNRLTVYGGKKSAALQGDTDITLLGGKYQRVYGGGYSGAVTGNTKVVFGGNANPGDGINDDASNMSPCYVFGGGYDAAVSGKTSVTLEGNAVTGYLVGAGSGSGGKATDTNLYINGGKAMNVYAGSTDTPLTNCDTHVIMTGGLVEAIFGGTESAKMSGNTYITLKGGEVSRRVYAGSYNGYGWGWSSSRYVDGTTNLTIYPGVRLAYGTGLSSGNRMDLGVYAGSRVQSNQPNERSTLIFLDGSYSTQKSRIGNLDGYPALKSHHDYVVSATANGVVEGTSVGGTVKIIPDFGYGAMVNGQSHESDTMTIAGSSLNSPVNVEFAPYLSGLEAVKSGASVRGSVHVGNSVGAAKPALCIAVFEEMTDGTEMLVGMEMQAAKAATNSFEISCDFKEGKQYLVKAMLWENLTLKPLTAYCSMELK